MGRTMRGKGKGRRAGWAPQRWPRASTLALLGMLGLAGCAAPVVFIVATARPAYDVHRCVTENLVEAGFRVVESRREDGIVRAERHGDFLGFVDLKEVDVIDVVVYQREDGRTGIQYTAGRLPLDGSGRLEGPEPEVEAIADEIATYCSD